MNYPSVKAFSRRRATPSQEHARKEHEKEHGTPFDKIANAIFAAKQLILHPTKGFRRASTTGTVASDITTGLKAGNKIPHETQAREIKIAAAKQYDNKKEFRKKRRTKP